MERILYTEKEVVSSLPLGQQLIKAGYRRIYSLSKELKCDEIVEEELNMEVSKIIEALKNKHGWLEIRKISSLGSRKMIIFEIKRKGLIFGHNLQTLEAYTPILKCVPKIVKLDEYIDGVIPDYVYADINSARDLGLKDFHVAYPVVKEMPKIDPIVFSELGSSLIFISQWD